MSKPWFHITSVTYSNPILTVTYDFARLRGNVFGNKTVTIDGFSSSLSFTEDKFYGVNEVATFSIPILGTSSRSTWVADPGPTYLTFGGTPSNTTNVKVSFVRNGVSTQYTSTTASSNSTLNFINSINTDLLADGINAVTFQTGNTFSVSIAPPYQSGSFFNGVTVSVAVTKGTGNSLTYSLTSTSAPGSLGSIYYSALYSGGTTIYNLNMYSTVGGYPDTFTCSRATASIFTEL